MERKPFRIGMAIRFEKLNSFISNRMLDTVLQYTVIGMQCIRSISFGNITAAFSFIKLYFFYRFGVAFPHPFAARTPQTAPLHPWRNG